MPSINAKFFENLFGIAKKYDPRDNVDTTPEANSLKAFIAGQWVACTIHGQPGSIHYLAATQQLEIAFGDGTTYQYDNVSKTEASSLYHRKDHTGSWVWSELRLKGTIFGFQKPYRIISGIKNRVWTRSKKSIQRHSGIGPWGESFPGFHPLKNH